MSFIDCRNCGHRISKQARVCDYCGAPTASRRNVVVIIAALSALCLVAVAVVAFTMMGRSPVQDDTSVTQKPDGDFAWLETAMRQCDEQATKEPKGLHYLVVPLVDEPRDEPGWRRVSINDIGNAILLKGEDMIAGLRRKALRISTDEYTFSARNEATRDVLTWKPSKGVRKFVINDAGDMKQFQVQFVSEDPARAINWGSTFDRLEGNCYWVNAILRH